jgi:polyferredoxin
MGKRARRRARQELSAQEPGPLPPTAPPRTVRRLEAPTWLQRAVSVRRVVQVSVGAGLWFAVSQGHTTLTIVIVAGSLAGVLLGKFFCRWMCPLGAIMETIMGMDDPDGRQRALYGYFKIGCPISWAQGLLNRVSLWRVRVDPAQCTHCNRCDKACYVAQLAPGHSLHVAERANASTHFSCSRCLQCVGACPTGALSLGLIGIGARGGTDSATGTSRPT